MSRQPSVLIVDRSEETREVLRMALERHGLRVLTAAEPRRGMRLARQDNPSVVVLDVDSSRHPPNDVYLRFAREVSPLSAHLILLGSWRPPRGAGKGEFVRKPYHFGPLVRRIEQLVGEARPCLARSA